MDYKEFAKRIKNKYPEYNDLEDLDLAKRVVKKYPEYSDVTFPETSTEKQETQIQESLEKPVQENITYKPNKFDDISPFLLYSPLYIPFSVLLIFSILIIKKKIKSGWARIGTCVSIMWTLFWGLYILLLTPVSAYSYTYNSAIGKIVENLLLSVFSCLIPFVLFFILYMTIKWILEGFKK
jgi:hypothetical protein